MFLSKTVRATNVPPGCTLNYEHFLIFQSQHLQNINLKTRIFLRFITVELSGSERENLQERLHLHTLSVYLRQRAVITKST